MLDNDGNIKPQEEGSVWAVSYSDLLMVIMSFFILFFSYDDIEFDEKTQTIVSKESMEAKQLRVFERLVENMGVGSVEQIVATLDNFFSKKDRNTSVVEAMDDQVYAAYGKPLKAKALIPQEVDKNIVFQDDVLFGSGGYKLSADGKKKIAILVERIMTIKDLVHIEVEGHSDTSKPRSRAIFSDNFSLSALRAGSVARQLVSQGVPKEYIRVAGFGDLRPNIVPKNNNEKKYADAVNRRVSIRVKIRK